MRISLTVLALIAMTAMPRLAPATGVAAPPADGSAASSKPQARPEAIVPTGEAAPAGAAAPPAGEGVPEGAGAAPGGQRFQPAPAKGIQPTVSRLPTYWQCQDDRKHRLVVTPLENTKTPTLLLERGGKKVLATQQRSGSGTKHMAPGGILFWDRGREATLQWGSPDAASCTPLGG